MGKQTKTERPQMGQRCSFAATVQRVHDGQIRRWESISYPPSEGIYVGYRKVIDGIHHSGGNDSSGWLSTTAVVEVWLFVTNPRKDSVRVMPQDVKWEKRSE